MIGFDIYNGMNFIANDEFSMLSHQGSSTEKDTKVNSGFSTKFPCPKCSSTFKQKGSLNRHLKFECGFPPRFQCPYCEHRTKKTSGVYNHIRKKHRNSDVYIIDIQADPNKGNILRP